MEIISFINHKGGVGKTTLCCNVAQALALCGHTVLCIDNDSQHNLTNRLGLSVGETTIRNIYRGEYSSYNDFLANAVRVSSIESLHCISSEFQLSNTDVQDTNVLAHFLQNSAVKDVYDFVCIDNHPGLDPLQRASVIASTRLIIPVLLKQQCMEGLTEMMYYLTNAFDLPENVITIVPNIAENIKIQQIMFEALNDLFGDYIGETAIPLDRAVEEVEQEQKILFLDRFATSKSAPLYAKLITELFPFIAPSFEQTWSLIKEERNRHRSEQARSNLMGGKNE